jgi:SAM-dependent methyltransferase
VAASGAILYIEPALSRTRSGEALIMTENSGASTREPARDGDVFGYLAWFQELLFEEVAEAEALYGADEGGQIAKYYRVDRERYLADPRHERHRYTRTRENFVARRIMARTAPRVLDCGCGLGSEAILFACLGATVTGVDLKPERLAVAASRRDRYARLLGRDLAVELLLENLFDLDYENEFDLIWVKEAISHIHPLPEFYAWALRALRPGGELLVSDPNAENARKRRSVEATRHGPLISTFPHPRTGERIPYADERILTIPELVAGVRAAGFAVGEIECFLPGQSSTPGWFWRGVMRPLNHFLPLARRLGDEYCVAAVKRQG